MAFLRYDESHGRRSVIEVDIIQRGDRIVARLTGAYTAAADEAADRAIAQACLESGCVRVLMDFTRVEVAAEPHESFAAGKQLGARGFTQDMRIAVLDRPEFREANELYALVARNRGYQLRHFYDEAEAMAWLDTP